ncbi:PKD domain-containing protein [Agromyces sp. MMS24-JH15]|uniref:PKD domain-containing protein n=1 Tax=Agromyces sp. MMS24-JH15 TaxID=3243765 RepID=UPI003748E129
MTREPEPSARPAAPRRRQLIGGASIFALVFALVASTGSPAWAAAPDPAVLVGPADGSTSSTAAPLLQVRPTDPDGGSLQVRFEGRRQGATVPSTPGDPFTIVAIPDTQNYTYLNRQGTMTQQTQWVADTRSQLGTAFAMQLGDLVSEEENFTQWGYTSAAFGVFDSAGMPYTVVPGNHDFDNATGAIRPYDDYFPPSRYIGAAWTPSTARYGGYLGQNQFGTDPVDRKNFDNYALFTAGGTDFLVLSLEWEAPQYALDWADRVLAAYPGRTVIMTTHSFVSLSGTRRTTAERPGGTSPAAMWNGFVSTHCQIRLVLSGHEHSGDAGEARRTDNNSCGQPVHQILTDYQDRANGGDGWLRYYTFDPAAGTMTAKTYSPKLGLYETDADSAFTLPFTLGTQVPAPFTSIATVSAASGAVAQSAWTGLQPDTAYEWRAVVSDGASSTTSSPWTVRTPPQVQSIDDTFTRTLATGWGRADTGQDWTLSTAASSYSIDGARGKVTVPPGSGRAARLASVVAGDVAITSDVQVTPVPSGSGTYVSYLSRLNGSNSYRAKLQFSPNGTITLILTRVVGGTETSLAAQRLAGTFTAGQSVRVAFETSGSSPTTVRAKAWPAASAEPSAWLLSATDATAGLQAAAAVGVDLYQSSSALSTATVAFERFTATPLGVTPPPPNTPPTAVIGTPTISGRTVTVSGAGSTDGDGTISGYAWNFGDGATATGSSASRTYTADGAYTITLTVTDDDGATGTAARSVTVAAPQPQPPVAAFTPTCTALACTFDSSASNDPDGTITSYAWTFGDGTTGTGPNAQKTYATGGSYTVGLTVTDNSGAVASTTRSVTVAAVTVLASDAFARTAASGWGTADVGGAWTASGGVAANYSVTGGAGRFRFTAAGATMNANLVGVSSAATDLVLTVSPDKASTGSGTYLHLSGRRIAAVGAYQLKTRLNANGSVEVSIVRVNPNNGGDVVIQAATTVPGLNIVAGDQLRMRVQVVGTSPTTIRGRVWEVGTAEPSTWQREATDATAGLQAAGGVGFSAYLSGSATSAPYTLSVDDLVATPQ